MSVTEGKAHLPVAVRSFTLRFLCIGGEVSEESRAANRAGQVLDWRLRGRHANAIDPPVVRRTNV